MFAEPPLSPYRALRNLKKSVDTIGNLLTPPELWKQQQDIINGIKDVYQLRERLVPRLFTANIDDCNLILNTPYGVVTIRNPACVPVSNVIPYESQSNDAPFVPPPQDGASGRYIFVSSGYQKFYDKFNGGTAWTNSERYWNHLYVDAQFPDDDLPTNSYRGDFDIRYWKSEMVDYSYARNPTPTITTNYLTLDFYTNGNPGYTTYQEDALASLPAIKSMAAGLTYSQAIAYAQTTDGRNYYYYSSIDRGFGDYRIIENKRTYQVFEIGATYTEPPPPPKKKKPKNMCCEECKNNEQLLKLVLKRIGNLPVNVPASYLTKNGVQPTLTKQITSVTNLIAWFAERFDEVIGEFEIPIRIDDSDLSQEGKQEKFVRLPNLAEAIGEIFTLQYQTQIETDLLLNMTTRILAETGSIKQMDFKSYWAIMSIIEYMGFPTKTVTQKLPLLYTPGEKSFDKLLKEKEINVAVTDYQEKDTFLPALQTLLQAAAIIRAVHYRKLPDGLGAMANQIKDDLIKLSGADSSLVDDIKKYLDSLNNGYNNSNKPDK